MTKMQRREPQEIFGFHEQKNEEKMEQNVKSKNKIAD